MQKMTNIVIIALFFLFSPTLFACLWDSDTIRDEMEVLANEKLFDLISGQFPHHGDKYYQIRVKQCLQALQQNPEDMETCNDLAVAYLRLEDYNSALIEFGELEEINPEEYKVLSNLGVLYKKMGDFDRAIDYTRRALEIKSEGHLGLGNYYLFMLQWKKEVANSSSPPVENFLGMPYLYPDRRWYFGFHTREDVYKNAKDKLDYDKVKALIRADRSFADAYVLLGDILCARRDLNLGLWCFVRAKQLAHPNPQAIDSRIAEIFKHWRSTTSEHSIGYHTLEDLPVATKAIAVDLHKCSRWLEQFKELEGELVSEKKTVDFAAVEQEMERRGIKRYRPEEHGIKKQFFSIKNPILWVCLILGTAFTLYVIPRIRRE